MIGHQYGDEEYSEDDEEEKIIKPSEDGICEKGGLFVMARLVFV